MSVSKRRLKILHVLDQSLPLHSGYAFRSSALFQAQKRIGWKPLAVTSPKHYESYKGDWRDVEQIRELRYYRTPKVAHSVLPLAMEFRIMTALAGRVSEIVRLETPDVLHSHSPILNAIPSLWVSLKTGIPMVYEMRALWEDAAVDHGTYGRYSWKYRLVRALETWVCRAAAHVCVISGGLRTDLIERGVPARKITLVPNGVDVNTFRPGKPNRSWLERWDLQGKKIIGFVGSFFRYEGLDCLVDAMAQIATARSDMALLLIGGGEMETDLREQINRLHLERQIVMPGWIAPESIAEVYSLFDVVVCPRYSNRLTELVTPLKPLEAMVMRKTLVASDVGGHRELINHGRTGLLFKAGSLAALVEALDRVLNDDDLREKLGQQAAEWATKERPWDKTIVGYSDAYSNALQNVG